MIASELATINATSPQLSFDFTNLVAPWLYPQLRFTFFWWPPSCIPMLPLISTFSSFCSWISYQIFPATFLICKDLSVHKAILHFFVVVRPLECYPFLYDYLLTKNKLKLECSQQNFTSRITTDPISYHIRCSMLNFSNATYSIIKWIRKTYLLWYWPC